MCCGDKRSAMKAEMKEGAHQPSGPGRRPLQRQATGPTSQRTTPSTPAGRAVTFVR
jgi:hypothetical protein